MNYQAAIGIFSLALILSGCGGSGSSNDNASQSVDNTVDETPELVSGYTLERRRAHKSIINAEYAENRSITGSGVGVAVFDRGINISHEEFGGRSINPDSRKVVSGFNAMTSEEHQFTAENKYRTFDDGEQFDENGHGTAVSSLIIGEEGGIAPSVDLLMIDITRTSVFTDGAVIIGMIDEIANSGFDFASASFGGTDFFRDASKYEFGAAENDETPYWQKLATRDIGMINGAGNSGEDLTIKRDSDSGFDDGGGKVLVVDYPNLAPQFLYVGSVTNTGVLSDFSSTPGSDANIQARFILAPGESVIVATNSDSSSLGSVNGTSFSTPIVSSAAALVKSQNPTLTNRAVLTILLESADRAFEGYDPALHGQGILDIKAALEFDTSNLERVGG